MSLAGPRNRTKIGVDPRNTNWSNNTDRFGHRILTTLGWQPGNSLGDTSSLYHQSGHITAASTTGVKVAIKDDNLGIGCNKRQREDECVGLDGFQDLLGRLNGKSNHELEKEAETRDRMRRETVVGERYGMRFVRGEMYVSSDIEALIKKIKGEKREEEEGRIVVKDEKKDKERKERKEIKNEEMENSDEIATTPTAPSDVDSSVSAKKGKNQKIKREKSSLKSASITPASSDDSESKSKKRKRTGEEDIGKSTKDKKDKISKKSKNGETHQQRKERRAGEKKARKAKKEKNKKKRNLSSDSSDSLGDESTPATSGTATPSSNTALVGRQAVRHRYIAAKRSAVMDAKALNEIFMIKG